jgi:uncharacterized protein YwqG
MSARDELEAKLKQADLGRIAGGVADLSKEGFFLHSTKIPDENILIGASKIGGWPDLPSGFSWPSANDEPLAFVAQINLSELPLPSLLPRDGLLSFFYDREQTVWGFDPKESAHWRVSYIPSSAQLVRTPEPRPVQSGGLMNKIKSWTAKKSSVTTTNDSCAVSILPCLSIPDGSVSVVQAMLVTEDEDEKDESLYYDFRNSYPAEGPRHQLLGWPTPIQNEMELECQLASNGIYVGGPEGYKDPRAEGLRAGAADWLLLFQIDTDDNARMMWGDGGMIYYWIRRQDLERRAFERTWFILQCH